MSNDETRPPTLGEVAEVVGQVSRVFGEQMRRVARAWSKSMREFWESPDGQRLAAVVRYYDEHPEELQALREENRPRRLCDCFCARWDHVGACTTDAITTVPISSPVTGLVQVPMCAPCATSVRATAVDA